MDLYKLLCFSYG